MPDGLQLEAGSGWFKFDDPSGGARGYLRVFYYIPTLITPVSRILIALHGLDRDAAGFRDEFIAEAERLDKIVIVPEFDIAAFPDVFAYNYGNVVTAPPNSQLNARDDWNFALIDRLFLSLKDSLRLQTDKFDLYGNSAGSQYVLRYVALIPLNPAREPLSATTSAQITSTLPSSWLRPSSGGSIKSGS